MQDKIRLINLLTLINEYSIEKNDKSSFTEYNYTTLSGREVTIFVKKLVQIPVFIEKVKGAKETNDPEDQWRVDIPTDEGLKDVDFYQTWNGCTFAVKHDGDIVNVCAYKDENGHSLDNMEAVMNYAVNKCNGTKLDTFDGNWEFYRKCGFEPRTWIPFNEDIGKEIGWNPERDGKEPVVFFEYTGNKVKLDNGEVSKERTEFYDNNKPVTMDDAMGDEESEYDVAYRVRDDMMKADSKQKNIMPKYSTILKVIEKSINNFND